MSDFDYEFGKPILTFPPVGALRELLKNYPDDTPITVCGAPGVFYPDIEQHYILLDTIEWDGYDVQSDIESPAMVGVDYVDF